MTDATRTPTPIDTIADAWVDTLAEQFPTLATYIGRSEYNDRYGDYSPEGMDRYVAAGRATLGELDAATPVDASPARNISVSATLRSGGCRGAVSRRAVGGVALIDAA